MGMPKIAQVRAYTVAAKGGADYHDQEGYHWIDDHIATPMAKYPGYADSRRSFGINVLGTLVVEVEATDGTVGFGVTTAGEIGAWIVEKHLSRFLEGALVTDVERIWDQMYLSTLFYGRKGIVLNAISAVDLALYDMLGKIRQEPVYQLLGGPVRDELQFYATGARPDYAQQLGFLGGKMPLHHGPAEGEEGLNANIAELAEMRSRVGDDFWLMWDCWMSLDLDYATRLALRSHEHGLKWIEECLIPDDYWGLSRPQTRRPARHARHDWRARVHGAWLSHAARDGVCRHHPAGRGMVRRYHRAAEDLSARRRPWRSARAPRLECLLVPLRHHTPQQPLCRVPHDGARGRRGRAYVHSAPAQRAAAGQRQDETARHPRIRRRAEPRMPAGTALQPLTATPGRKAST